MLNFPFKNLVPFFVQLLMNEVPWQSCSRCYCKYTDLSLTLAVEESEIRLHNKNMIWL